MSSAPHDDTASLDSFSTTTSLDAMEAAEIKANIRSEIACGFEIVAKLQEFERP